MKKPDTALRDSIIAKSVTTKLGPKTPRLDIPDRPTDHKWKRIGECRRCGSCCTMKTLMGEKGYDLFKHKLARLVGVIFPENVKCPHLRVLKDGKTKCKIYKDRPWFCKDFPEHPDDIINIPDCGFSFVEVEDE